MDLNTSTSTLCKVLVRQTLLCVLSKGSGYQNYNTRQVGVTQKALEKESREQGLGTGKADSILPVQ